MSKFWKWLDRMKNEKWFSHCDKCWCSSWSLCIIRRCECCGSNIYEHRIEKKENMIIITRRESLLKNLAMND